MFTSFFVYDGLNRLVAEYDFYTGAVTRAKDVDNNVSAVTEYDALGRATKVRTAAGTALEAWTRSEYDDVARRVIVSSDVEAVWGGPKMWDTSVA